MNRERVVKTLTGVALVAAFLSPVSIAHYMTRGRQAPTSSEVGTVGLANLRTGQTDPETVRAGKVAFYRNCAMCHGYEAVGKVGVAPSLNNRDFQALATDELIRTTVREGRLGTAMAPRRELPKVEVDRIIAYLRSLPDDPARVEQFPLDAGRRATGDVESGRTNYGAYCSPCHGPTGGGYTELGSAPGIGLPGFLKTVTDDYIIHTVSRGRMGTSMRSFLGAGGLANLSEQDIEDIVVFLRNRDPAGKPQFSERLGEEAFNRNCASCHQPGGVGLVGIAPSLSSPEFLSLASDDFIRRTVRKGRRGTTMVSRPLLTDWELDAIIEYLRALPTAGKSDLTVDETRQSTGDPDLGRENFGTYCAPCHGPQGEGYARGGSGPGIGLPSFLASASDDYIFKTVTHGRTGTSMRPFTGPRGLVQLEEQDVHDIIAFLRNRAVLP